MHDDQIEIDEHIVKQLIRTQFPKWAHLDLLEFPSQGTGHAIFRLGKEMYVRLPITAETQLQMEKELKWLPKLAPHLSLAIPIPLGSGEPDETFPFQWAVYSWIEGDNATRERIGDEAQAARDLATFIQELHAINPIGGPGPGKHNFFRGEPLANRDAETRKAIKALGELIDGELVLRIWENSLAAPKWSNDPVWIHGDIHSGNLIANKGRITAVIDFGGLGIGDPACDLLVAWWLLSGKSREVFKSEMNVDEATWRRGRGWALSMALIALPYYLESNPEFAELARWTIHGVLSEYCENS